MTKRSREEGIAATVASLSKGATDLEHAVLSGVEAENAGFTIQVRYAKKEHKKAVAGDAITLVVTPDEDYEYKGLGTKDAGPYIDFTNAFSKCFEQIGKNAARQFGSMVYSLSYNVTLARVKGGKKEDWVDDFIVFPCTNGRVVTATSPDWTDVEFNKDQFNTAFAFFANRKGSGITLEAVHSLEIQFVKSGAKKTRGGAVFPRIYRAGHSKTPLKDLVSVKNEDNRCFQYAILAALSCDAFPGYPTAAWRDLLENPNMYWDADEARPDGFLNDGELDWSTVVFGKDGVDYEQGPAAFEAANPDAPFALNVWMHEQVQDKDLYLPYTVYLSKKAHVPGIRHIDLFLAVHEESSRSHYMWIHNMKNFIQPNAQSLLTRFKKGACSAKIMKDYWCRKCVSTFDTEEALNKHLTAGCFDRAEPEEVKYISPEKAKDPYWQFNQTFKMLKNLICITVAFDSVVDSAGRHHINHIAYDVDDGIPDVQWFVESSWSMLCHKCAEGECNCVVVEFVKRMKFIEGVWSDYIKYLGSDQNIHNQHNLTEKQEESFQLAENCYLCNRHFGPQTGKYVIKGNKHRDHCHITGQYRGAACPTCNQNFSYTKHYMPVMVQNSELLHHIIKACADTDDEIELAPMSINAYGMGNIKVGKIQFINSESFMEIDTQDVFHRNLNPVVVSGRLMNRWKEFRSMCLEHYRLDPVNYTSLPSMAWDAAMIYTRATPDLISDPKMHEFLERAKRGGINFVTNRYFKPNNPHVDDYSPEKPTTYLANFDIKSSYGYSMKQYLPYSNYKWLSQDAIDGLQQYVVRGWAVGEVDGDRGYFLEVDMHPPTDPEWHDEYSDFPLAFEHKNIEGKRMLVGTLEPKERYVVHYRLLKYYLSKGIILDKIHAGIQFRQKPWLAPFMQLQEDLREVVAPDMKSAVKLITNSIYGKTIVNAKTWTTSQLYKTNNEKQQAAFERASIKKTTTAIRHIANDMICVTRVKPVVWMTTHPAVGCTIAELGKLQLYQWYYDKIKKYYPETRLLYTDTDSLIVSMRAAPMQVQRNYPEWFNGSVGSIKEESGTVWGGNLFVAARPKLYIYETEKGNKVRIAGLNKEVSGTVTSDVFKQAITDAADPTIKVKQRRTENHEVQDTEQDRKFMNTSDLGRVYVDEYTSLPYGHYKLKPILSVGDSVLGDNIESWNHYADPVTWA